MPVARAPHARHTMACPLATAHRHAMRTHPPAETGCTRQTAGAAAACARSPQGEGEREVVRVTVECCLQEKAWNPYYALLLAKLCEASKSHKITLQVRARAAAAAA
jgi:hypothetical protein